MNKNERIAEFAAKLISQGSNPIIAVMEAMQTLDPKPERQKFVIHTVSDDGDSQRKED